MAGGRAVDFGAVYPSHRGQNRPMAKHLRYPTLVALPTLLFASCQSGPIDNAWALRASKVEAAVDGNGRFVEVEYHISPDLVPVAVRGAMSDLRPGTTIDGAEYEIENGATFYELTGTHDGRGVAAMFSAAGELHVLEIQIDPSSEPAITRAVLRRWPGGTVQAVEEVRDGEQLLVAYHVDLEFEGRALKVTVDRDANVTAAVREMEAELEVPVELPKL